MRQEKWFCDCCEKEVQERSELYLLKMALHKNMDVVLRGATEVCSECVREKMGIDVNDRYVSNVNCSQKIMNVVKRFFNGLKP